MPATSAPAVPAPSSSAPVAPSSSVSQPAVSSAVFSSPAASSPAASSTIGSSPAASSPAASSTVASSPASSSPVASSPAASTAASTSAAPASSAQVSSSSAVSVPAPSTTSLVHTTSTSTKLTLPTFSFPSISIPTFSLPNGNNGGAAPTTHAGNGAANPGRPTSTAASYPTAVPSKGGKGHSQCIPKHKRSKRLFMEDLEIREYQEVDDTPALGVAAKLGSAHRSRRRFMNHYTHYPVFCFFPPPGFAASLCFGDTLFSSFMIFPLSISFVWWRKSPWFTQSLPLSHLMVC